MLGLYKEKSTITQLLLYIYCVAKDLLLA